MLKQKAIIHIQPTEQFQEPDNFSWTFRHGLLSQKRRTVKRSLSHAGKTPQRVPYDSTSSGPTAVQLCSSSAVCMLTSLTNYFKTRASFDSKCCKIDWLFKGLSNSKQIYVPVWFIFILWNDTPMLCVKTPSGQQSKMSLTSLDWNDHCHYFLMVLL